MLCDYEIYKERVLSDDYLSLWCEKNSNGTRNLRLKGNELFYRIKRRIHDRDMSRISDFLFTHPLIVKLDLPYNDIGDDGMEVLVNELLSQENYIIYLNLVGCNITSTGLGKLCNAWETLKLKSLRLTGNKLGSAAGACLETLLLHLDTLHVLDLGDTNQTLSSIPYYCSCLQAARGGNGSLRVLDISTVIPNSQYYQYAPSQLADQLGNTLKLNETLIEIHMQKCQFDGHDIQLLLNGLKFNKTLKLLDIGYNRINNFGAEMIAEWLKTRPCLRGLNLAGNSIGEIGGNALSYGLPFSVIRLLDISDNKITDQSLCDILQTIKKKYQIRVLYLWGNKIGPITLKEMERQMQAGIYVQEQVDFKIYFADDRLQVTKFPSDHYKSRYYCQLTHGEVQELRIKRNQMESMFCERRTKVNLHYYTRIEGTDECKKDIRYLPVEWEGCNFQDLNPK